MFRRARRRRICLRVRIPVWVGMLEVLGRGVKVGVERGGRTRAVYWMIWRGFSGRLMS